MRLSSFFVSAGLVVLAQASLADYTEKKGERVFSGQLIVRPKQIAAMMDSNVSSDQIKTIRDRSRTRIASIALRYIPQTDEYIVKVPLGAGDNFYSKQLMATGDYEYAAPNFIQFPAKTPNDPLYPQQWHHAKIGSPSAWNFWTGSSSRIISFCDTGIMTQHPDLKNLRIAGYNAPDRMAEVNGGQVEDIHGHGTHVSGDGAAQGNNGVGVAGVGWNFKIMHCRITNSSGGGAFVSDMMDGARWAIEHGAKTTSVSYSGVDSPSIGTTGTYIKSIGGLLLFAAGNDNRDLSGFKHPDTIVVGASDQSDGKAGFSAYGRGCTLFAPGTGILSTTMDGGYQAWDGTSMATPVANGALATLWSVNPDLTPDEAANILFSTCDNIGPSTIFGYGRVNVGKGVALALSTLAKDATITDVQPALGATYIGGSLDSVRDTNPVTSFDVRGSVQAGVGPVSSSSVTAKIPIAASNLRSVQFTALFNSDSTTATTVFVYVWNRTTGAWDLQGSKGTYMGFNRSFDLTLKSNLSSYLASDGTARILFRAVTPARLSGSVSNLRVSQVKARYVANPSS